MNKILVSAVVLACWFASGAEPKAVVQVKSFPCVDEGKSRFGSGTLINANPESFVITSAHVVFSENRITATPICHRILVDNKIHLGELVAIDSLNGLALLHISDPELRERALSFQDIERTFEKMLAQRKLETGEQWEAIFGRVGLSIAGFRYGSSVLRADPFAKIYTISGDTLTLPKLTRAPEIIGYSEFGMSGGALFSPDERYVGLLSHHYIEVTEGSIFRVCRQDSSLAKKEENNRLDTSVVITLPIPLDTIVPWVRDVIGFRKNVKNRVNIYGIREDAIEQLGNRISIAFKGFRLTEENCVRGLARGGRSGIGGSDGAGIGKVDGDGAGIGGLLGDGAGIGGDGTNGLVNSAAREKIDVLRSGCRLEVLELAESESKQEMPFPIVAAGFKEGFKARQKSVYYVASLIKDGKETGFYSLHNALALMVKKDFKLVPLIRDEIPKTAESVIYERIEVPKSTRCFCKAYEPLKSKYELYYTDRDGEVHHIGGMYEGKQECLKALVRTPLCLSTKAIPSANYSHSWESKSN